ncbi:hypothetical protein [Roseicella aquatilis]|uniref:Uncharacterized protein n=1 Tax=Roseicella aquatilis TaxID=2527868 RepID=A0A4R4D3P8_9PROT|nr:hypothetical protein [Roseicella aquatilis]TCZ51316.1 hypothetical protein EXY23_27000 [Roseicella aquatilis]
MRSEIEIAVFDGETLVQRCPCTLRDLPDGRPGVVWRGVVYPLLPGDRIDVSAVEAEAGPEQPFAVLGGEGSTWVLVRGLAGALAEAQARLGAAGIRVSRSGRWLGDPVGDVAFDWFLRCEGTLEPDRVGELLGRSSVVGDTAEARIAVLEQHLFEMKAELARLAEQLNEAARPPSVPVQPVTPVAPERNAALEAALERVRELQARLDAVPPRPAPSRPAVARLQEELAAALAALRPDVILLRDSLQVVVGEFVSRAAFYRILQELPVEGGRPKGWKALRGAERWWERHVSSGQDDSGRAYARFDPVGRRWDLLMSWKGEQARDIEWLRRKA